MIQLYQTCAVCPEQYDAYRDGKQVGYLRVRHGHFRCHAHFNGGPLVYQARVNGDGCFTEEEKDRHLSNACTALEEYLDNTTAKSYEIMTEMPKEE